MSDLHARAQALWLAKRKELEARYPALRAARPGAQQAAALPSCSQEKHIVLGRDQGGTPFIIPNSSRFLHSVVMGVPGSGKSNHLFHGLRQDILNGSCSVLLDPHASHPDSVFQRTKRWLLTSGIARSRAIHIIDPGADCSCGFNPLYCPPGSDPTVVANNALRAVEEGWGGEDTQMRPTLRRGMRALFTAVAELELTLLEAPYFLLPDDPLNARAWALQKLHDERARAYFERLAALAGNPRMRQTFEVETVGILNRIEEFTSSAAIRRVFGHTKGIDLLQAMERGDIVLVNLSGGANVFETEGDLLGRTLLGSILYSAKRRTSSRPCFVWMDEGHRFLSGDVPNLLEEVRKHSVGITIAHQDLSQLGKPGDRIREAVLTVPQNRVIFRLNSMAEATLLGPELVKLDLECPVQALIKPTVVGQRRVKLANHTQGVSSAVTNTHTCAQTHSTTREVGQQRTHTDSRSTTHSESESNEENWSESETDSASWSKTHTEGEAHTESDTDTALTSISSGSSGSSGSSSSSDAGSTVARSYDRDNIARIWPDNTTMSNSAGTSSGAGEERGWSEARTDATGTSHMSATTTSSSDSETHGGGHAETRSRGGSRARTTGRADTTGESDAVGHLESRASATGTETGFARGTTHGHSSTGGWSEAFEPIYEMLPAAVHSKENVVHRAAEMLCALPTGIAVVKALVHNRIESALVQVPRVDDPPRQIEPEALKHLVQQAPGAVPSPEVDKLIAKRRQWLKAQGARLLSIAEETETFRQPLRRVKGNQTNVQQEGESHA